MDSKALDQYNKHIERVRAYNAAHKEELNNAAKAYYHTKIKTDPEKYKQYLDSRKEYQKQKRMQKKQESLGKTNNILKEQI